MCAGLSYGQLGTVSASTCVQLPECQLQITLCGKSTGPGTVGALAAALALSSSALKASSYQDAKALHLVSLTLAPNSHILLSQTLESHVDDGRCFGFYSRNEGKSWKGLCGNIIMF